MLSKKNRISRALFSLIFVNGQIYHSSSVYIQVAQLRSNIKKSIPEKSKFAFVISKKAVKKAVSRNKLRRIGYSIIQKNLTNIKNGYLVSFFFKKNIISLSKIEIENEIIFLLKKTKLLMDITL